MPILDKQLYAYLYFAVDTAKMRGMTILAVFIYNFILSMARQQQRKSVKNIGR